MDLRIDVKSGVPFYRQIIEQVKFAIARGDLQTGDQLPTHDMDEADRLSDRVAIIDHGRLLELDTPDGLKNRVGAGDVLGIRLANGQENKLDQLLGDLPDSLRSLICKDGMLRLVASDTMETLPAVFSELRRSGLEVEDVSIRKKTLEDVFIALTGRRLRD